MSSSVPAPSPGIVVPAQGTTRLDNVIAIGVFLWTIISYVLSRWWLARLVPKLFRQQELTLIQSIAALEKEAEKCNTMDQLHRNGKLNRQLLLLQKELQEIQGERYAYEVNLVKTLSSPTMTVAPTRPRCAAGRGAAGASSSLVERVCAMLVEAGRFTRYNTPRVVELVIKYGHIVVLLATVGNRPAVIPRGTDAPVRAAYLAASLLMFGDPQALRDRIDHKQPETPGCELLFWCILCVLAVKYAVRVLL